MKSAQNGKRTNFIFLDNVAGFEFAYLTWDHRKYIAYILTKLNYSLVS